VRSVVSGFMVGRVVIECTKFGGIWTRGVGGCFTFVCSVTALMFGSFLAREVPESWVRVRV